jgi:LuxR family transcriptional regulator, maltose regulon positive regulatory protein
MTQQAMRKALRAFEIRTGSYLPQARFRPPTYASGLIERPRLYARLEEALSTPTLLLRASPGYGKTVLLGQWFSKLRHGKVNTAWLTLDESCRDARIFLGRVIAALFEGGFEHHGATRDWLSGRRRWDEESIAQRIADSRSDSTDPTVLFLDDLQHLNDSAAADCLKNLVEASSGGFHLIMASRGEPCIARSRLISTGQLRELEEREIAFTPAEIGSFYQHTRSNTLPDAQCENIGRQTEGWVCGLVLLHGRCNEPHPGPQSGGVPCVQMRRMDNFFSEQSFGQQPAEIRHFLLVASLLKRFCAPLYDAVSGGADGARLLQHCERNGLFLIHQEESGWFRFHSQFGQFLRARARELPAPEQVDCHRRASSWLAANGCPLDASEHAMLAGDVMHAAQLLDDSCDTLFGSWRLPGVPGLAARLPESVRARFPRVTLAAACQLIVEWRFDEAETLLTAARARLDELAGVEGTSLRELHFLRGLHLHRTAMLAQFRDQPRATEQLCEQLLRDHHDAPSYLKGRFYTVLLNARRQQFKLSELDRLDALARQHNIHANNPLVSLVHDCITGIAFHMAGRTESALARLQDAVDAAAAIEGRGGPHGALAALPLAEIRFARNELEAAESLVGEFMPSATESGLGEKLISGWLTKARLTRLSLGDAAALAVLEEATTIAGQRGFRRMQFLTGAERIKIMVRAGRKYDADAVAQELDLPRDPAHVSPAKRATVTDEAQALAWMRLALAHGKLADGLRVARHWRAHHIAAGAYASLAQWEILLLHQLLLDGQERAATRTLRGAFSAARHGRLVRLFLDEGPLVTSLVGRYSQRENATADATDSFAAEVAAALPEREEVLGSTPPVPAVHLVGCLTQTEIQVLTMAGAGLRNCDVGERLGLTEGSIKWCLQQIYDKIGVRKRSQAIDRARRLGLISA